MIDFNYDKNTYVCPHCGCRQALTNKNYSRISAVAYTDYIYGQVAPNEAGLNLQIFHITCSNEQCNRVVVLAYCQHTKKQWDLIPENVCKQFPEYIPQQIRNDYQEACSIINNSPKAAATLLRRCLQGMIHDFWGIKEKNLNAEITALKDKVTAAQWKALDGLRTIGNIGAHMEKDVNLIIDIEPLEALKLQKLIELFLEKWYINRHEEEQLYADIAQTAEEKEEERKK